MAELNLTELREVAEAATPGPWVEREIVNHDERAVVSGFDTIAYSSGTDTTHIATFDPPTVLALLDRVAELEAVVARVDAALGPRGMGGCPDTAKLKAAIRTALAGESDG